MKTTEYWCRVCQTPTEPENLTHLKIYVAGSEGVDVCITCRQTLTEVLRGMMRTNCEGRKQGYLAAKKVAAAGDKIPGPEMLLAEALTNNAFRQ